MTATGMLFKRARPHREGAMADEAGHAEVAKKVFKPLEMIQERTNAFLGVLRAFAVPGSCHRFMRAGMRERSGLAVVLLSLLLMGMDNAVPADAERMQLEEKQAQLTRRIETLQKEQDYLLFQKSFFGADSKYLVLDLKAGTGTLKYRNRTLRTFGISIPPVLRQGLHEGRYLLTDKTDGSPAKRSLVFQDSFSIRGRGYSGAIAGERKLPGMVIGSKDLAALFFAVDKGAMLYIR